MVYIRYRWPDTMCEDQRSHLGKTIDALIIGMQTAQLTFNGRTITEFFAILFLFRCREKVPDPPNSP